MTKQAPQRITFLTGVLDEVVLEGARVHLEQQSKHVYMLIVETDAVHLHLTVRKPLVYEYLVNGEQRFEGDEWQEDLS